MLLALIHSIFPKYFKWKPGVTFAEYYQQAIDVCSLILYRVRSFADGVTLPDVSNRAY